MRDCKQNKNEQLRVVYTLVYYYFIFSFTNIITKTLVSGIHCDGFYFIFFVVGILYFFLFVCRRMRTGALFLFAPVGETRPCVKTKPNPLGSGGKEKN